MEANKKISEQDSIETPNLAHFNASDYDNVYEPREDSFLFLDALEKDLKLIQLFKPSICVEIGSGSGVICTAVARLLGSSSYVIATDLNPFACEATHRTAEANHCNVSCIQMDLDSMLKLDNSIDLLLFNPPYVVTTTEELKQQEDGSFLHLAWAGGIRGREVTDRLLSHVGQLLSQRSLFYLVVIKENNPSEISDMMARQGFVGEIIASRKVRNEFLSVMRFKRG